MVANTGAGTPDQINALRDALPLAETVECEPADIEAELEKAAIRARVLGVCGGDGTVNTAARIALRHGLPLAVLPGGTLNHFAHDLGVEGPRDLIRALQEGNAIRVDVGRFSSGGTEGIFLNTCSLGVYPELVRERERWSRRIGEWPAGVLGVLRVLRTDGHPLQAELGGRTHPLWLLFAGNGTYHRMGLAPPAATTSRTDASTYGSCTAAAAPPPGCWPRPSRARSPAPRPRGRTGAPSASGRRRARHPPRVRR